MAVFGLPPDEVHVHILRAPARLDPELEARCSSLLTAEERSKRSRFHFPEGRLEYLLTRVLVRLTLSSYRDVAPHDWRFEPNAFGRPEISEPRGGTSERLRFNLSNVGGVLACIVGLEHEVGVDIESTRRKGETSEIAERFFSPLEVADLRALPQTEQRARFFWYWTPKEAYIRARGQGLSLPLDQFSFLINGGQVGFRCQPEFDDRPHAWLFGTRMVGADHVLSYAVRRANPEPVRVLEREFPLPELNMLSWSRPPLRRLEPFLASPER